MIFCPVDNHEQAAHKKTHPLAFSCAFFGYLVLRVKVSASLAAILPPRIINSRKGGIPVVGLNTTKKSDEMNLKNHRSKTGGAIGGIEGKSTSLNYLTATADVGG